MVFDYSFTIDDSLIYIRGEYKSRNLDIKCHDDNDDADQICTIYFHSRKSEYFKI